MRIFGFIFTAYILALSLQPCQEWNIPAETPGGINAVYSRSDHVSGIKTEEDDCSPFCVCSCCYVSVADRYFPFALPKEAAAVPETTLSADYQNPNLDAHVTPIWQPPKFWSIA